MIEFQNVGLHYGSGDDVLSDVNFTLQPGSFHFVTGASGAGKSSLLRLIFIGHKPSRGNIIMFGKDIKDLQRAQICAIRQKIGVVFQEFRLLPHLSVYENVSLPLRILGTPEPEIANNVPELLEWVGLGNHIHAYPETLSGGQQQRVAIARAIIGRPKLLLADEPTGNLDDGLGLRLMNLFEQLNRMGTTIVIASHNQNLMNQFAHPRLLLENGKLYRQEPKTWIREKIEGVY